MLLLFMTESHQLMIDWTPTKKNSLSPFQPNIMMKKESLVLGFLGQCSMASYSDQAMVSFLAWMNFRLFHLRNTLARLLRILIMRRCLSNSFTSTKPSMFLSNNISNIILPCKKQNRRISIRGCSQLSTFSQVYKLYTRGTG